MPENVWRLILDTDFAAVFYSADLEVQGEVMWILNTSTLATLDEVVEAYELASIPGKVATLTALSVLK